VNLFGGLFFSHVEHVVGGDDAHHRAAGVSHGQGDAVILFERADDLVAVGRGGYRHQDPRLELADFHVWVSHHQVRQPQVGQQRAARVDDEQHVQRLAPPTVRTHVVQRLSRRHRRVQRQVLRRHEAASRVLRVAQKLPSDLQLVGLELLQRPLGHLCWQLLKQTSAVVGRHLVEHARQGIGAQRLNDLSLLVERQVLE
jgi:hypothetical protein